MGHPAHEEKFQDDCRFPVRPFDYTVEGRATGPPQRLRIKAEELKIKTLTGERKSCRNF
jgi:hypothetical protein